MKILIVTRNNNVNKLKLTILFSFVSKKFVKSITFHLFKWCQISIQSVTIKLWLYFVI